MCSFTMSLSTKRKTSLSLEPNPLSALFGVADHRVHLKATKRNALAFAPLVAK